MLKLLPLSLLAIPFFFLPYIRARDAGTKYKLLKFDYNMTLDSNNFMFLFVLLHDSNSCPVTCVESMLFGTHFLVCQSVLFVPVSMISFVIIVLDKKEKRVKIMSDAREILTWHN